jgi:hypothetical protein
MAKRNLKKKFVGNLNAFQRQMVNLESGKYNFRVEYNGNKRHIIYLDENDLEISRHTYFGKKAEERFEGAHIVREVKKELLERIDAGEKPPKFVANRKVVVFNKPQIISLIENNEGRCVALDINSCYWNTAHELGIVSDRLYNKYMDNPKKWKKGMVASIGALNKKTAVVEFRQGKLQTHYMDIEFGKLRPYYWAVINRVNELMNDVVQECGDDFLMWLTDCVYVREESAKKARQVIGSYNYSVSKMKATMLKVAPRAIHFKNDKKHLPTYINYSERQDVSSELYDC